MRRDRRCFRHKCSKVPSKRLLQQLQAALRDSECQLRACFNGAIDAMLITDDQGRYLDVNPAACELMGLTREELLKRKLSDFAEPGFDFNQVRHTASGQERSTGEFRLLQVNGTLTLVEYAATTNFLPHRHLLVLRDISAHKHLETEIVASNAELEQRVLARTAELSRTNQALASEIVERQQAETALKASELKLTNILNSTNAVITSLRVFANQDWEYEYHSSGCEKIFGYSPEELKANKYLWLSRILREDLEAVIFPAYEDIFAERPTTIKYRFQHRDGTIRWISETVNSQRDEAANCWRLNTVQVDITEAKRDEIIREQAEAALQHRVAFETLLTMISTQFINLKSEEIDQGINQALQVIGTFVHVDRVYVYVLNNNQAINTHEWSASGVARPMNTSREVAIDAFPWLLQQMQQFKTVHVPEVTNLPAAAQAEKQSMQAAGIRSFVVVPIVYGGVLIGTLGFNSTRSTTTWSDEDIALLVTLGDIFAHALVRKQTETALRQSEERFSKAFHASPIASAIVTFPGGQVLDVNDSFLTLLGYDREEVIDRSTTEINLWVDLDDRADVIHRLHQHSSLQDTAFQFRTKSGELRDGVTSLERIHLGEQPCLLGMFYDVTERNRAEQERKQAEDAVRERERRIRLIADSVPVKIAYVDSEQRYRFVNQQYEERYGTVTELLGKSIQEVLGEEIYQQVQSYAEAALLGQRVTFEVTQPLPDGEQQYFDVTYVPHLNAAGAVLGYFSLAQDITQRKQIEAAVRSQAQKEQALNRVIQAIRNSLDLTTIFSTAASEIGQLLQVERVGIAQYFPQQKIWRHQAEYRRSPDIASALDVDIPDEGNPISAQLKQMQVVKLDDASTCDDEINRTLAQMFPGGWLLVPLPVGSSLWGSLTLTRSRRLPLWQDSELALARTVADQLAIAIQQAELHRQVQVLNADLELKVQERTTQLQQALNFEALLKRITDKVRDSLDEAQILQTVVQELGTGLEVECCDTSLYDSDLTTSTIVYEYITASMPPAQGQVALAADVNYTQGQLQQGQHCQFCIITDSVIRPLQKQFAVLACPILDEQGAIGELWLFKSREALFDDLEVRLVMQVANQCAIALRQARLYQAAQTQVEELERLNRLKDDFLNTVSHELRSPMTSIKMATQMLEIILAQTGVFEAQPNRATRYFQILQAECQREINLINDLLDLARLDARVEPLVLSTVNLKVWLSSMMQPFVDRAQSQQQRLQLDLKPELPPLTTDLSYLGRIIGELLNNACKYTPSGETITVRAEAVADAVLLSISNSGVELPVDELDRIFEKFYRVPNTDPWKHGGTGLGLALVKKIVRQLGGTIHVESAAKLTTFTVQLPLAASMT